MSSKMIRSFQGSMPAAFYATDHVYWHYVDIYLHTDDEDSYRLANASVEDLRKEVEEFYEEYKDDEDYYTPELDNVDWVALHKDLKQDIVEAYDFIIQRNLKKIMAKKIQSAWRECRYNPKYKMCEKVLIHNIERDTGMIL